MAFFTSSTFAKMVLASLAMDSVSAVKVGSIQPIFDQHGRLITNPYYTSTEKEQIHKNLGVDSGVSQNSGLELMDNTHYQKGQYFVGQKRSFVDEDPTLSDHSSQKLIRPAHRQIVGSPQETYPEFMQYLTQKLDENTTLITRRSQREEDIVDSFYLDSSEEGLLDRSSDEFAEKIADAPAPDKSRANEIEAEYKRRKEARQLGNKKTLTVQEIDPKFKLDLEPQQQVIMTPAKFVATFENGSYAEYEIEYDGADFEVHQKMRFKKWYSLVDQIHQKTTAKSTWRKNRNVDPVFATVEQSLLTELDNRYQALKVSKESFGWVKNWSGRNAAGVTKERAEFLTNWFRAFQDVAGNHGGANRYAACSNAQWRVFNELLTAIADA